MATWGGFSRDGRIAPNDNLARNNNNNNNNNNNHNHNNHNIGSINNNSSSSGGGGNHSNINIAPFASASANANTNTPATGANFSTSASTLNHYLFGGLNVPDVHLGFSITNNDTIPSRYSFSPLPSPSDNDSLFATVGDTLQRSLHRVQGTSSPTSISSLIRNTTDTGIDINTDADADAGTGTGTGTDAGTDANITASTAGTIATVTTITPTPPLELWVSWTAQHSLASSQNYYPFATPSLPYIDTTPTILPQPHMSNTNVWSNPSLSQAQPLPRVTGAARSIDDPYLATLATQDFSSPSLPPLSHSTSPTTLSLSPRRQSKLVAACQDMPPSSTRRRIGHRGGTIDLTKEEPDFDALNSGIDLSIPLGTMPVTTRRRSLASADPPGRKRRPSAATSPSNRPNKSRRKEPPIDSDSRLSPFGEDDPLGLNEDGVETIDLSNATEVPAELMAPKVDNRVKIGNFQCVICMDDTTALTVTHCGHLFCSDCLHSSLHIDSMKRTCPVCRAKVELKDKNRKPAKSYFHLELKVMTATKKGKRPVGA
ncbi:hypothetical protein CIB48_g2515 [Xylaria polymorpha]|nr:hypothetical protein CIB48_g2515 [Xylaria polymorpha]